MQIGIVRGREIRKNKDGETDVLLLQVEISDPEDIQTVQLLTQAGEDSNPPDGSLVAVFSVGEAWKICVAVSDGIIPTMEAGEKKIYSSAAGVIKAFIDLLKNGDIEVNGEEIKINGNALVQINAPAVDINGSTEVTVDAPAVDINGSTEVTVDAPLVKINGNTDFAVRYSVLESVITQFLFAYNIHLHPGVTTGGGSTGATAQQAILDISGAKVDTVKLP